MTNPLPLELEKVSSKHIVGLFYEQKVYGTASQSSD